MKTLNGIVVSRGMQKTVVVEVTRYKKHRLYKRLMKIGKKYKADVNGIEAQKGDLVSIVQTRPQASSKHFKISGVIRKGVTE